MRMLGVVLLVVGLAWAAEDTTLGRNPLFEASDYLVADLRTVENGTLDSVSEVPGTWNELRVAHLWGSGYERGLAHGRLLAEEIYEFAEVELPLYYVEELESLTTSLPDGLRTRIDAAIENYGARAFELALDWVYQKQQAYIPAAYLDEMDGIGDGVCDVVGCSKKDWRRKMRSLNMLPELVRMECSMLGAWGAATVASTLTQLRTLDFGDGPFANRTTLLVHHPTDSATDFVNIGFPGFVGVVTGVSSTIALSEKVDDNADGRNDPGSYDGLADALVLREMLQYANTWPAALAIAQNASRTWTIWAGIGDGTTQPAPFAAIAYDRAEAVAYDDVTLPNRSGQAYLPDVAYLDKHAQPSTSTDLYDILIEQYGNLSAANVAQLVPHYTASADVHAAVYGFSDDGRPAELYVATGATFANGTYFQKAYESPFVRFDLTALWGRATPLADADAEIMVSPRPASHAAAALS